MRIATFHTAADREFIRAAAKYEVERPGLGEDFIRAVYEATDRAVEAPEHGSPYRFSTRRIVLSRFPYSVVYVVLETRVVVVAVEHHRRRPGYWRRRLPKIE